MMVNITQLEVMQSYNPLLVSSQLSTILATMPANKRSSGNSSVKAGAKRKYQPPPIVCNDVCHIVLPCMSLPPIVCNDVCHIVLPHRSLPPLVNIRAETNMKFRVRIV